MASDQPLHWDAVFENPETGFIPLIMQSKSAEALKQTALLVIRKLHTRKNDEPNIEKYSAALDAIFLDIIRRDDLNLLQAAVKKLLRDIKKERIQKAAAYLLTQRSAGNRNRRAAKPTQKNKPFWRTRPTKQRAGVMVAVVLVIIASIAMILKNPSLSPEREAEGRKAVRWVKNYVARNLPMTSLRLASVKITSDTVIEIAITVSRTHDPKLFKALKEKPNWLARGH